MKETEQTIIPLDKPKDVDIKSFSVGDFYKRLGVSRNASHEDIMRAYASLASIYYQGKQNQPTEPRSDYKYVYDLITEAYDTLMDPKLRIAHDIKLDFTENSSEDLDLFKKDIQFFFQDPKLSFSEVISKIQERFNLLISSGIDKNFLLSKIVEMITAEFVKRTRDNFTSFTISSAGVFLVKDINALSGLGIEGKLLLNQVQEIANISFVSQSIGYLRQYGEEEAWSRITNALATLDQLGFNKVLLFDRLQIELNKGELLR
jgi:curved DNA-binding protein CbpA